MEMKEVLVVGLGGVGVIAAYTLDSNKKVNVTAVIRSDHDTVQANGFHIDSVDHGKIESYRPARIVRTISDAASLVPAFDYVVVCTKNVPDVSPAAGLLESVITPEKTVIVLVQNGIGIEKEYFDKYPRNIVLSGVSMISSTNYGGRVSHVGHDSLSVGYFPNSNLDAAEQKHAATSFVEYYKNDANDCVYDENVNFIRWRKLVYNATLNPICALTNVDVGRLELFGGTDSLVRAAMKEVVTIAKSDGAVLPESIVEAMIRSDDGVYYAPSMLVDIRKGNYIELEVICGNALRIARKNNVDTPILSIVYNLLHVVQQRIKESHGKLAVPEVRPVPRSAT